eukprot:16452025-Heterocapsa_arctica.AAC.1
MARGRPGDGRYGLLLGLVETPPPPIVRRTRRTRSRAPLRGVAGTLCPRAAMGKRGLHLCRCAWAGA